VATELLIETLAFGGRGIGHLDGKAVFVPLTAPGDLVRCRLTRDKLRYAEAQLEKLLSPGPDRCPPHCPVFGQCGGCQWQHLSYPAQVSWKQRILHEILIRQAGLESVELAEFAASADPFNYRSRVQLKVHAAPNGVAVGFFRTGSHFVIDIEQCPIADPRLNQLIPWIRELVSAAPRPDRIPQVDAGVGDDGALRLVVHLAADFPRTWHRQVTHLAEQAGYALFLQQGRKQTLERLAGDPNLQVWVDNPRLTLSYGPGGFAQVHAEQNRRLVAEVLKAARLTGSERVLDLYCGMGNFSLPLARHCYSLLGIEDYAPSIAMARENASRNNITNASFHARPAESIAEGQPPDGPIDLVLLDPPRSGAAALIKPLLELLPKTILYLSCDPMTQARDLRPLLHGGYRLRYARGFDLFPQTYHIESFVVLDRVG